VYGTLRVARQKKEVVDVDENENKVVLCKGKCGRTDSRKPLSSILFVVSSTFPVRRRS
jgi:hypothetical protein